MGAPEGVTRPTLEDAASLGGALRIPLWNRNPATLPYPTSADNVDAGSMTNGEQEILHYSNNGRTV